MNSNLHSKSDCSAYVEVGDIARATVFFESALRHGSPFEAYYQIAEIHSNQAHSSETPEAVRAGSCGIAVSFYKLVAERGSWKDNFLGDAERLWDVSGARSKSAMKLPGADVRAAIAASGSNSGGVSPAVRALEKDAAKLRWSIAAEAGSEVAQNNLAYLMDQGEREMMHDFRDSTY